MLRFKKKTGDDYPSKERFIFGDRFSILKNNTLSRDCLNYEDGPAKNIHYGDILVKFGFSKNVGEADVPFINSDVEVKGTPLKDGDVVIADTAEDTTAGKATELIGIGDNLVVSGLHTIPCRPSDKYAPGYLGYYINSYAYRRQLFPLMQGTKVTSINRKNIEESIVEIHTFEEQQKIANCLSAVDNLIADYEGQVENMQKLKKGVAQKLFSQEIRFRDKECEYPEWKERRYREIGKIQGGFAFKSTEFKNTGVPIIRISNIIDGVVSIDDCVYYDDIDINPSFIVNKGDLLIAMSGATTGKNGVYYGDSKAFLNQRVGKFVITDDEISYRFIIQWAGTATFENQLKSKLLAGAQPNISSYDLELFTIKIPSLDEQQKIADCLSAFDEAIENLQKTVDHWGNIKKGLLQQLFE